jgi:hypothetical protein
MADDQQRGIEPIISMPFRKTFTMRRKDIYNATERIVPVGATLPNTNNNQKRGHKTKDKK